LQTGNTLGRLNYKTHFGNCEVVLMIIHELFEYHYSYMIFKGFMKIDENKTMLYAIFSKKNNKKQKTKNKKKKKKKPAD
jgi:hypothetical protein